MMSTDVFCYTEVTLWMAANNKEYCYSTWVSGTLFESCLTGERHARSEAPQMSPPEASPLFHG